MESIVWYQAAEVLKVGDFVICKKDPIIWKWNGISNVPIGNVIAATHTDNYKEGDRVPVKSIWYCDKLMITLKIGDQLFVRGSCRDYVERKVKGLSDDEIREIYEAKNHLNEIIYDIKKFRDNL